jgi:7-cyano-7-deazaguanine reductase
MPPKRKPESDLRLLGRSAPAFPDEPAAGMLDTFPNRSTVREYWVTLDCEEFTSLCPVTGQADYARLTIRYIPNRRCLETKSLKYYLASYRNTRQFNEDIVNRILADLVRASHPKRMHVCGAFAPRGGIRLTVDAEYPSTGGIGQARGGVRQAR